MKFSPVLSATLLAGCIHAPQPLTSPTEVQASTQPVIVPVPAPVLVQGQLYQDIMGIVEEGKKCRALDPDKESIIAYDKGYTVPLFMPVLQEDLVPHQGLYPSVGLRTYRLVSDTSSPDEAPDILPQDPTQCKNPEQDCTIMSSSLQEKTLRERFGHLPSQPISVGSATGSIIDQYTSFGKRYAVVITAAHAFSRSWDKAQESAGVSPNDEDVALFTKEIYNEDWKSIPTSEVDMQSTYDELIGKEATIFLRYYGCSFSDTVKKLRFTLLASKKKDFFLAPSTQDAHRYFGGVSGAAVYVDGKIVGIFTGIAGKGQNLTDDELRYLRIVPIDKVQTLVRRNQVAMDKNEPIRDLWQERFAQGLE